MKVGDTINVIIEVFNWGRRDTDELKNARYVEFKTERIPFRSPSWARAGSASGPSTAAPRRSRLDSRVAGKRQPVAELEMTTPEGHVKRRPSGERSRPTGDGRCLQLYAGAGWLRRPGPDFYMCAFGRFLAIETKAPGKKPTARQTLDNQ